MLYIITAIFFLIWCIFVTLKGRLNWHSLFSIYFATLFVVDYGDVPFDFWFNFYDLPVHLFETLDIGGYLGVILSDGIIFPLIAIVFCYYSVQYHRPWTLSFLFASILGIIEFVYVQLGYMVYHHWNHWITPIIIFVALLVLSHFADRLIKYSPPISYGFRLLCSIYVIVEWPGAILGGAIRLYQYRPNIFTNETADSRLVAVILTTVMGVLAAIFVLKTPRKYKIILFLGLGAISSIFALWMHSKGLLLYNNWNSIFMILRYIIPYFVVYLYDRWESAYTKQFDPKST